jgi:hypothetical protein
MPNQNESIENVDERLNSAVQQHVAAVVRSLPEETLSMAWRSSLNERMLVEVKKRQRVRLFGWIWKPTSGLALAGALALAVMFRPGMVESLPVAAHHSGTVEANLVSYYRQSTVAYDVAGPGLAMPGDSVEGKTASKAMDPNWTEDDLSSL